MKTYRWLLLLFAVIWALTYLPHHFLIPHPQLPAGFALLACKPYYTTTVDYASFFEPFSDFAREFVKENHALPLWNTYALFGLPMIEQSEHSILNPLQWGLWLGGPGWRIFATCLYLTWGAWGVFRLLRSGLGEPSAWLAFSAALLYALAGGAQHGISDFCCLMHVMCLPHVVLHAAGLVTRPLHRLGHFAHLLVYVTLLLLTGQPQYLLVGGLGVGLLLLLHACLARKPAALLLPATAGFIALLVAAPMLAPFLEANLGGMAYPGNHQLGGSASYWKINLLTFSQLFSHRLTGFVGITWFAADKPALAISYESFSIAFGVVGVTAALAGSLAALRHVFRRKASDIGALRAATSITALSVLGMLLVHNLSESSSYPWFFRFVNLAKYAPPVLALALCLGIPAGLRLLVRGGAVLRSLLWIATAAFPAGYLLWLSREHAQITNETLRTYSLAITFLPVLALGVAALALKRRPAATGHRVLAVLLLVETLLLVGWGMPLPFEWGRVAAVLAAGSLLLLAPVWPRVILPGGIALMLACLAALGWVRSHTNWNGHDPTHYQTLRSFADQHEKTYGYKPRILGASQMTSYPWNAAHGLRSVVSRCPVIPLATQALLFDYIDPLQLEQTQRRLSFLEFHGAIQPGAQGFLSWTHFAEKPELFSLLGIDYAADFTSGPLAKEPALQQKVPLSKQTTLNNIFLFGREAPLGKVGFFSRFTTVAFSPDAWNVRRAWREAGGIPTEPVVEIDAHRVPKWEGFVQHGWFEAETNPAAVATTVNQVDRSGRFTADVTTTGRGLLVFREQFWPGWEARINGTPAPLLRVNSLFQGVLLPHAGAWHVEFLFVGTLHRDLLFTLAGLLAAGLMLLGIRHYEILTHQPRTT